MSFILLQTAKGGDARKTRTYVHWTTSVWNRKTRRSEGRRVYVGVVGSDGESVAVSKSYGGRRGVSVPLSELRRLVESGKDVEAWLRSPPEGSPEAAAGAFPAGVEIVGDAHALLTLAEECGLRKALRDAFGEEDGEAACGLAIHQAAEGRPLYLAGEWLSERSLPEGMRSRKTSPAEVYGVPLRIGSDPAARESFFRAWIAKHGTGGAVLCDTTSISTYSEALELAERGHNRDGEDLPQVNLTLAASAEGVPLWLRLLPGSVPDVSTLRASGALLRDLGVSKVAYSLDRGFHSQANLRDLLNEQDQFVIGVPLTLKKAKALIRSRRAALSSPKRSFSFHGQVMRHDRALWPTPPGCKAPRQIEAHVFYDPRRQTERAGSLEQTVFELEAKAAGETFKAMEDASEWISENAKGLAGCLAGKEVGGRILVLRKPHVVAQATANMGYMVVAASELGLDPAEALGFYRRRDLVEKLFDTLKNEDGQHRLRTGSDSCAEGRALIAFAALALHSRMESKMRSAGILKQTTVAEILAKLRKVKAVTTASGKRILLETPKKTKEIFSCLGVPLPT
jgi:hypothetical protein